jgi:DNA-binding MarR family transcriptional regulator
MLKTRGFLHLTYKLYHHLDKLGERKASCLCVYLGLLKYAWKKNNYTCHIRHATLEKDTQLSRPTIKRCLDTLEKMNVIKTVRGKSGKTYVVNDKFLKEEKAMIVNNDLSNVNKRAILEEESNQYKIGSINVDKNDSKEEIISKLTRLSTAELNKLILENNNPYYCRLAIQEKENAGSKKYVNPNKVVAALTKIRKMSNPRYREKVEYNKRNNLDWKGKPINK